MAKDSGGILNIVLIAGGAYVAYLLYENFIAAPAVVVAPPSPTTTPNSTIVNTGSTTGTTSGTSSTPPPPPPSGTGGGAGPLPSGSNLSALATKVLALAGGNSKMLTADQWNYYWTQASGVHQTANLFPTGNRAALMSFGDYLAARQTASLGVSGLGQLRNRGRNYVRRGTGMRRLG